MADIRTVLGRRDSADIGRTLVHEHALVGFPGWFLDTRQPKYNRDEALVRVAAAFEQLKDYGVSTVIDPFRFGAGCRILRRNIAKNGGATGLRRRCVF